MVTVVKERHVISYTNDGIAFITTNDYRYIEIPEQFVLEEKWVRAPAPNVPRPPLLQLHR